MSQPAVSAHVKAIEDALGLTLFERTPRGMSLTADGQLDWPALAELPWVYPTASACCGRAAERLFETHHIRPQRVIRVDREQVTRTLIAGGTAVGLLHADTAHDAVARGEVELVFETPTLVRVLFAHLASRAHDPLLAAASAIMRE